MADTTQGDSESPTGKPAKPPLLKSLGPGLITGAADDDPSGIATYSQAGAQFGYQLTWALLITYPLMVALQMISARVGRTTGRGLAALMRRHYPRPALLSVVVVLVIANTINIGADLGAMADGARLLVGGRLFVWVVAFALLSALLQVFLQYARYIAILKWLTLALFAYVATAFLAGVSWTEFASNFFFPSIRWQKDFLTMVVAVFGTTISPYLFFWQASQEAEEVRTFPTRQLLKRAPEQGQAALERIRLDTLIGMGVSNIIALAIMATTAAALHANNIFNVESSAQAAAALEPIAGKFAGLVFALGIIGTGLLAIPVLAGSVAYSVGEAGKWPIGLARQPSEAKVFYGVIVLATLVGMLINFTSINPIRALYWSAVINGVAAVPMMIVLMSLASSRTVMGNFQIDGWLRLLGWLSTIAMAGAAVTMLAVSL